eukprot:4103405-Prymnesium_polylepis.1
MDSCGCSAHAALRFSTSLRLTCRGTLQPVSVTPRTDEKRTPALLAASSSPVVALNGTPTASAASLSIKHISSAQQAFAEALSFQKSELRRRFLFLAYSQSTGFGLVR